MTINSQQYGALAPYSYGGVRDGKSCQIQQLLKTDFSPVAATYKAGDCVGAHRMQHAAFRGD